MLKAVCTEHAAFEVDKLSPVLGWLDDSDAVKKLYHNGPPNSLSCWWLDQPNFINGSHMYVHERVAQCTTLLTKPNLPKSLPAIDMVYVSPSHTNCRPWLSNASLYVQRVLQYSSIGPYQHAQPSLSLSRWMSIGSEKSPLNSSDSSCAKAFLAITANMNISTRSKYWNKIRDGTYLRMQSQRWQPLSHWSQSKGCHPLTGKMSLLALRISSACSPQRRFCFQGQPIHTMSAVCSCEAAQLTKGKFSGSRGLACIKNSSLQLSKVSKLLELLTS